MIIMRSLFIFELDGPTVSAAVQARNEWDYERQQEAEQYAMEAYAEGAWARAAETNDQYAYEVEQDELRAAAYAPVESVKCVFGHSPAIQCPNEVTTTRYTQGRHLPACELHRV